MALETASYHVSSRPLHLLDMTILRGANAFAWSPVVRLKLDLGTFDEVFTNTIEGFFETLKGLLPSLHDHHCSVGAPGGFFQRMQEGTLLGHVLEHCALELQVLAGMDVTYGKTRSTAQKGVYNVVFSYLHEEAGIFAAKAALNIVNSILLDETIAIAPLVEHLRSIAQRYAPSYTTQTLIAEARRRRIPLVRLDAEQPEHIVLGTGKYAQHFSYGRLLPKKNLAETASNLDSSAVLPPSSAAMLEQDVLRSLIRHLHLPWKTASQAASRLAPANDYRILLLNDMAVCALKSAPPIIAGDGETSMEALVERLNRQRHTSGRLQPIRIDDETLALLAEQGFTTDTVLPKGIVVTLKREATLENGGAVIEMTDEISADNLRLFSRIAKFLREHHGIIIAELRITTPSLRQSLLEEYALSETVAHCSLAPDMRLYQLPTSGRGYNIAQNLLLTLFPTAQPTRIPLVAITAGIGGDFLATMLDDALTDLGYTAGHASPQQLSIRKEPVPMAHRNGTLSALVQTDIDCAILETPLRTIVCDGLQYDRATVGVILNLEDISVGGGYGNALETQEDAAEAHALVAEYLEHGGIAVLNANNLFITRSVERYDNETMYFATSRINPDLALHCSRGGRALVLEGDSMMLLEGKQESRFLRGVRAETALDRDLILALAATLLAFGINKHTVRDWLETLMKRLFAQEAI